MANEKIICSSLPKFISSLLKYAENVLCAAAVKEETKKKKGLMMHLMDPARFKAFNKTK